MQLVLTPGVFALGIAVGVLGLVLLLSLIISYAYDERTLLVLAGYLSLMVAATLLGQRLEISDDLIESLLLIAGPAVMTGLHVRLLKNRRTTLPVKALVSALVVVTLGLITFYAVSGPQMLEAPLSVTWGVLILLFALYLLVQSWQTAGPWKWWLMLGHVAGVLVAVSFLANIADAKQPYWSVVFMLLLQVPPTYLSLVWRSRLLNESRLRSEAADTTDPLTGLATTRVLVERLMRVMSRAHQATHDSALFLIETRNWQGLLNELGNEFNEKMLLEAALRLRRSIGDNDLVARIAGGRFAVVAQGLESEAEVNALATRLVVSGLRIDSPLLPGVEFQFRVIVRGLKSSRPMALADTETWLSELAERFVRWPGSHRSRSILVVPDSELGLADAKKMVDGPKLDSDY